LSCQRVKLVGKRHPGATLHHELAFANHMHQLNARNDGLGRSKRFETRHRPADSFDRAMILLDDIVEIFNLPDVKIRGQWRYLHPAVDRAERTVDFRLSARRPIQGDMPYAVERYAVV
jgi:hypothetical protein